MKFLPVFLAAVLLAGCSAASSMIDVTNLVDYSNHKSVKVLEIPPDLDAPKFDKTYITSVSDKVATTKPVRLDRVPLVDESLGVSSASLVKVSQTGSQVSLQLEGSTSSAWKRVNEALKGMGMTVSKANQASGLITARDRSLISDPGSPIGRFLNRSLGRINKGAEYQFRVTGSDKQAIVEVADKAGNALPEADARVILGRLRKEYTS